MVNPDRAEAPTQLEPLIQASLTLYAFMYEATNGDLGAFLFWFRQPEDGVIREPSKEEL